MFIKVPCATFSAFFLGAVSLILSFYHLCSDSPILVLHHRMLNYCDDGGHAFEINNCRHYDLNVDMLIHVLCACAHEFLQSF